MEDISDNGSVYDITYYIWKMTDEEIRELEIERDNLLEENKELTEELTDLKKRIDDLWHSF